MRTADSCNQRIIGLSDYVRVCVHVTVTYIHRTHHPLTTNVGLDPCFSKWQWQTEKVGGSLGPSGWWTLVPEAALWLAGCSGPEVGEIQARPSTGLRPLTVGEGFSAPTMALPLFPLRFSMYLSKSQWLLKAHGKTLLPQGHVQRAGFHRKAA